MNRPNYLFLIGGADLEMLAIKRLLTANGFAEGENIADHHLAWGAKLSDYKSLFNDTVTIVGIELIQDITPPPNYINIDHHNESSYRSSSLEQVIELLNKELGINIEFSRDLQLISANDKGYIPAMLKLKATKVEIADIRQRDRDAQGITVEDERLAEQSILEYKTTKSGVTIVNSLTPHFSTITDRLYPCDRLLISHQNHFTYFGKGTDLLAEKYKGLISQKRAFYGGENTGFFGIAKESFTKKEVEVLLNEIINLIQSMSLHSYHIFLFPFKWDTLKDQDKDWERTIDIKIFSEALGNRWEAIDHDSDDKVSYYNQLKYFHQFVQSAIFENKMKPNDTLIKQFEYPKAKGWKYKININQRERLPENESLFINEIPTPPKNYKYNPAVYTLTIDKITLDLFTQGVGIFAFHLENREYHKPEHILLINQFGRRVYPPFLDKHFDKFNPKKSNHLEGTQHRELPIKITIETSLKIESEDFNIGEDFNYYASFYMPEDIYLPGHIAYFFQNKVTSIDPFHKFEHKEISLFDNKLKIKPILDDRMFVICWYGANQITYDYRIKKKTPKQERKDDIYVLSDLCQRMKGGYEVSGFYRNDLQHRSLALNQTHDSYGYATNDFWYQYVFVDGFSPSCANGILRTEQIEKHTYSRWVENNTLYGITRHSFVCITEPKKNLENPFPNAGFIIDHVQSIYFRMVSLVLAQRAMILKFSADASDMCKDTNRGDKETVKTTKNLLVEYTRFINQFFYREITAQEQGIELYNMLQEHLRVEYQAKELEKEINDLHRNADLIERHSSAESLEKITVLGGIFLIPSLIAAFVHAEWFNVDEIVRNNNFHYWWLDNVFKWSNYCQLLYVLPHGRFIGAILYMGIMVAILFTKYINQDSIINKLKFYLSMIFLTFIFTLFYPALTVVMGFIFYAIIMLTAGYFTLKPFKLKIFKRTKVWINSHLHLNNTPH